MYNINFIISVTSEIQESEKSNLVKPSMVCYAKQIKQNE